MLTFAFLNDNMPATAALDEPKSAILFCSAWWRRFVCTHGGKTARKGLTTKEPREFSRTSSTKMDTVLPVASLNSPIGTMVCPPLPRISTCIDSCLHLLQLWLHNCISNLLAQVSQCLSTASDFSFFKVDSWRSA